MAGIAAGFRDKSLFVRLFGGDVYAVGGYVRDLLPKRPSLPSNTSGPSALTSMPASAS